MFGEVVEVTRTTGRGGQRASQRIEPPRAEGREDARVVVSLVGRSPEVSAPPRQRTDVAFAAVVSDGYEVGGKWPRRIVRASC